MAHIFCEANFCTKAHQFEDVAGHFEKIFTSRRTKVESRSFVGWFTLNGVRVERLYWRLLPTSDKVKLSYCCLDRASLKEDNCTNILQLILNAGPKFRFATEENIDTFIHFHIIEEKRKLLCATCIFYVPLAYFYVLLDLINNFVNIFLMKSTPQKMQVAHKKNVKNASGT